MTWRFVRIIDLWHTNQLDRVRVSTEVFTQGLGRRLDLIYPSWVDLPEQEEVLFHIQGYAVWLSLPPIIGQNQ